MNGSLLSPAERRAIKAAFRQLVTLCGGPHEAAESCRVSASVLSRYGSENAEHEGSFPPADVVKELEMVAGEPLVTRLLADIGGYELAARIAPAASSDFAQHGVEVTSSFCEVLKEIALALADGRMCPREASVIEAKLVSALREGNELLCDIRRAFPTEPASAVAANVTRLRRD